MNIEFGTRQLLDYFIGNYEGKQPFSEEILKKYRKALNFVKNAQSMNDVARYKGLNLEKMSGKSSIRVDIQYRIEFEYNNKTNTFIVQKLSKHYE